MTWGLKQPGDVLIDYASYILNTVVKARNDDPKYIGGGEVLTRIIYEAMGKTTKLNRAPSQNLWLMHREEAREDEEERRARPSSSTIGPRRLEKVVKGPTQDEIEAHQGMVQERVRVQKRKDDEERETRLQKRAKMERMLQGFVLERSMRGDTSPKCKPCMS